jgi:hypothetical protein
VVAPPVSQLTTNSNTTPPLVLQLGAFGKKLRSGKSQRAMVRLTQMKQSYSNEKVLRN